ncbi:MAG: DNA double-strand break repair nuclease NurA [Candidatus Bathyarchaeia archaeon]
MSSASIEEIYRRYEFNKTEPETLVGLIQSVIKKSDVIKSNYKRYKEIAETVYNVMKREKFLASHKISKPDEKYGEMLGFGVDGSFQCIGGMGGIWYVPISCARIKFLEGLKSTPKVSVAADIHDVNQMEYMNIEKEAEFRMLAGETKAIKETASEIDQTRKAIIFIDGPIVDPPWVSSEKRYQKYVLDRCEAIKMCLDKNAIVVGCVKRIMGSYLLSYVVEKLTKSDVEQDRVKQFISDAHLITYVFTRFSMDVGNEIFYTSPVDISQGDIANTLYHKKGIEVCSIFLQKDATARPIRLDIPSVASQSAGSLKLTKEIIRATVHWSYPGHDVPLPIILAHEKCNIRRGCAEVLYNEMITRTTTPELFDNIVKMKLE